MSGSTGAFKVSLLFVLLFSIIQISGCRGIAGSDGITQAHSAAPPVVSLTASPVQIPAGGTATLNWNVTGAVSASINGMGNVPLTGTMQVTPTATTTYTLGATGAGGDSQAASTVTVGAAGDFTFTATPAQITPGQQTTLAWNAVSETSVSIDNGVGTFPATGSIVVTPSVTTSYHATATGAAGTKTAEARVTVTGMGIQSFTASPTSIGPGASATLTWNVTGATSVSIDNGVGTVAASGTTTVAPNSTTTYTLTATGVSGTQTAMATVAVTTAVTVNFSAAPNNISAGQSVTLTWSSTNANGVTIDNGVGAEAPSGSTTVTPLTTTTYTATATGAGGTAQGIATVTVTPISGGGGSLTGVLRYKGDISGTGANLNETKLTLANVNATTFGRLNKKTLDGVIFAEPLYVANLTINGGTHNVLYLATEHDKVYALDADTLAQLWVADFTNAAAGISYVANSNDGKGRTGIGPSVGITGTPVIDASSNTMYVSAMTDENGVIKHHLHAIDITTGTEKFGGPVEITGTWKGTGIGNDGNGNIPFDPEPQNQRSGLQLVNGVVYVPFASFSDVEPYHGWLFAIDARAMKILAYLNVTPSTEGGGMWMGGAAPVADSDGYVYVQTADGEFTMNAGGTDLGDSNLKLKLNGNSLDIVDWFTPFNQDCLNRGDLDFGASGAILLPDQPGGTPHLMVTGSKEGRVYLLNRDNLGHFSATGTNPQIPQDILINPAPCGQTSNDTTYRMYGTGTFWNNTVYLGSVYSGVRSFNLANAKLTQTDMTTTIMQGNGQQGRGVIPVISANGATQGILWFVEYGLDHNIILHAYNATDLSNELYNTNQNSTRDALGFGGVFVVPTVYNGKVFVISSSNLNVYGLLK